MMPALASMVLGGLAHSLTAQGFGGVLGQLTSAAEAPAGQGAAGKAADSAGMVTSMIGNLFGGGQSGQAASGLAQAGLSALTGMLAVRRADVGGASAGDQQHPPVAGRRRNELKRDRNAPAATFGRWRAVH